MHDVDACLEMVRTTREGLSESEALRRRAIYQKNRLEGRRVSPLRLWIAQFQSPIILLLAATAGVSYFLDDTINAALIFFILLASGSLGFYQEYSAANAMSRLLALIATTVHVLRDGRETQVPSEDVVPGDVILVKTGTVIPADCRILEARNLLVNEAALTGESFPVEKCVEVPTRANDAELRRTQLFMGTHVSSGTGRCVVIQVGNETEFGTISRGLHRSRGSTGFEVGLQRFGRLLVVITACLVSLVFLSSLAFHRPVLESLLFSLALAVGMTPQLLPAISSVVLAAGAKRMAHVNVIVKRLLAIENFGSMNVLCMDKTGTLTTGNVQLIRAVDMEGKESQEVLQWAAVNARLQTGFDNPIDHAIAVAAESVPISFRKLDELPYDFHRRRLSVLVCDETTSSLGKLAANGTVLITKGAAVSVLEACRSVAGSIGRSMDEMRPAIDGQLKRWGEEGFRILGVAIKEFDGERIVASDESNMTLTGFLLFADPLKSDVAESVHVWQRLGIALKIITGDSVVVAKATALRSGLQCAEVTTGRELHAMDGDQRRARVLATDLFAEVEPEQKQQIVADLKREHFVVGFLGDGINDAPALHNADVGISVSTAVDVAKEAADVVLLEAGLDVLSAGVVEGRKTLANTLKYVYVAISANFGYMLSMAIASLFLPFLPLLPNQILVINLLADFPAMALATDRVDEEQLLVPRQWDLGSILKFMLLFGLIGTASDLLTFAVLLHVFEASEGMFRTGWFLVSIMTGLGIMLSVRTRRPLFTSRPGTLLWIAIAGVFAIAWSLPWSPLGSALGLVQPDPGMIGMVFVISAIYIGALELGKLVYFRQSQRMASGKTAEP